MRMTKIIIVETTEDMTEIKFLFCENNYENGHDNNINNRIIWPAGWRE